MKPLKNFPALPLDSTTQLAIDFVRKAALKQKLGELYLFGSHARGDAGPTSDIDLALNTHDVSDGRWLDFLAFIHDQAPTLRKIELLRLDRCRPEIRQRILKEGILLNGNQKKVSKVKRRRNKPPQSAPRLRNGRSKRA